MNMKPKHQFQILAGHLGYVGMLFAYETENGLRWSHSLLNHGAPLLESSVEATHHFWDTKNSLPAQVHDAIFGKSAA